VERRWAEARERFRAVGGALAELSVRPARAADAAAIAAIYNQGIAERIATFETEPRTAEQIAAWLAEKEGRYPVLVAERGGEVVAWAGVGPYSERACYAGIVEFSVYAERAARGTGAARAVLAGLVEACERAGFTKLYGKIFVDNVRSLGLCRKLGFREVGVHRRHARLDGVWRDVVVVERLIGEAHEGLEPSD
jgi:L-amino acid N-acyltransferase YncA